MNVYLDIDGVLIGYDDDKAANYADEFIKYVLTSFPDSTYWLTTHCQGDASRPVKYLENLFDDETVKLLKMIKPTTWVDSPNKTSAIDFTKPFLWFDDNLFYGEKQDLLQNDLFDNYIEVNLRKDPNQLHKFLHSFPIPSNNV